MFNWQRWPYFWPFPTDGGLGQIFRPHWKHLTNMKREYLLLLWQPHILDEPHPIHKIFPIRHIIWHNLDRYFKNISKYPQCSANNCSITMARSLLAALSRNVSILPLFPLPGQYYRAKTGQRGGTNQNNWSRFCSSFCWCWQLTTNLVPTSFGKQRHLKSHPILKVEHTFKHVSQMQDR